MNFCKMNGIRQDFTNPYTLQQNGVAERKNRTIVEMAMYVENKATWEWILG
jgi:transposase InsO family protein